MNSETVYGEAEKIAANPAELPNAFSQHSLSEAELQQLAEKVYRLLREDARLESVRAGEGL